MTIKNVLLERDKGYFGVLQKFYCQSYVPKELDIHYLIRELQRIGTEF